MERGVDLDMLERYLQQRASVIFILSVIDGIDAQSILSSPSSLANNLPVTIARQPDTL